MRKPANTIISAIICLSSFNVAAQVVSFPIPQPFEFKKAGADGSNAGTQSGHPKVNLLPQSTYQHNSTFRNPNPAQWNVDKYGYPITTYEPRNKEQIARHEQIERAYLLAKEREARLMMEIERSSLATNNTPATSYNSPLPNTSLQRKFESSLMELHRMLKREQPIELTRAQYLVESTYDHRLTYDFLKKQVLDMAYISSLYMQKEGLPKNDNVAKILAIFQVMADTTKTYLPGIEKEITTYPMLYDFEDPWGRTDFSKMFVTKLLSTGTGNCTSLPRLFLMVAEALGAEAQLSFAPQHSYVKFKDHFGEWHNVELTNQMFTTDDHIMEYGWVKSEAIRSEIYMHPITKKELVSHLVNELAMSYQKIYGDTHFVTRCTDIALKFYPNSITAHQINANYYANMVRYIGQQYQARGLTKVHFENDEKVNSLIDQMLYHQKIIDDLGYSDIPETLYNQWIKAMNNEANKEQSRNTQRKMIQLITR